MSTDQNIFFLCISGAVSAAIYFILTTIIRSKENRLYSRLRNENNQELDPQPKKDHPDLRGLITRLGQAAASPFMPKNREKQSTLRRQLAMAGIYSPSAIRAVTGFKLILLIGGISVGLMLGFMSGYVLLFGALGGIVGYLTPMMWLKSKINQNQKMLQLGLPDALDLMVVCVEAGLTIDAAMQRVGEELAIAHPAISREYGIAHMETRIGLSRAEALRNMGQRTGNSAIQQLVAMLVQAERFGTSVADALRIQSETLRIKRQHIAEETAAKASVKMSFPLVLFIFPATFIVLAGPTVLGLMKSGVM
ncbi:MAG: secretion protein [Phycisphaerae bacterium]|jgi:tight adherence protein C|nr:MAG: secretion protein [Phycisphaerae bacterium]